MTSDEMEAVLDLKSGDTQGIITKAELIVQQMTANAAEFTAPEPPLATIHAQTVLVRDAIVHRDALITQLKAMELHIKDETARLKAELVAQAAYVTKTARAKQDASIPAKAGMRSKTKATPITSISTPQNLNLQRKDGVVGAVQLVYKAVPKAKTYGVQYCTDPVAGNWSDMKMYSSSKNNTLIADSGSRISVRVKAFGPNNTESGWSNKAEIVVP